MQCQMNCEQFLFNLNRNYYWWRVSVVVCVHGTAWMMSCNMSEILSSRPKLVTRRRSSIQRAWLPAVLRMRRRLWAVPIRATPRWTMCHRQFHVQSECRWNMHVIRHRRMPVHRLCVTVNLHCQLVCYFVTVFCWFSIQGRYYRPQLST